MHGAPGAIVAGDNAHSFLELRMSIAPIWPGFANINVTGPGRPSMPPQSGPPLDVGSSAPQAPHGFANELAQLEDYHAQRASELKAKYGETPPDMVGVAMPVDVRGFSPFVTAEQQRLIDSVTDKYIGRTDLAGLMEELRSLGVHPHQIAQNAEHYTAPGGIVVDRAGRQVKRLDVMI